MKKRTQISSPSKHYTTSVHPSTPGDNKETLVTYFGPDGGTEMTLAEATNVAACLSSHTSAKEDEVIDVDMEYDMENDGEVNKEDKEEDNKEDNSAIDGNPGNFMPNGASGEELGHNVVGTSPMVSLPCLVPPPRHVSALRTSSFVPVPSNPVPSTKDAVDMEPNFFEGTNQDGVGPSPHFITISFVKNKDKIRDQLVAALTSTVGLLCKHLPDALIHCI
jgi:hypothetical protein